MRSGGIETFDSSVSVAIRVLLSTWSHGTHRSSLHQMCTRSQLIFPANSVASSSYTARGALPPETATEKRPFVLIVSAASATIRSAAARATAGGSGNTLKVGVG